jgi:hypothetical protein
MFSDDDHTIELDLEDQLKPVNMKNKCRPEVYKLPHHIVHSRKSLQMRHGLLNSELRHAKLLQDAR